MIVALLRIFVWCLGALLVALGIAGGFVAYHLGHGRYLCSCERCERLRKEGGAPRLFR